MPVFTPKFGLSDCRALWTCFPLILGGWFVAIHCGRVWFVVFVELEERRCEPHKMFC